MKIIKNFLFVLLHLVIYLFFNISLGIILFLGSLIYLNFTKYGNGISDYKINPNESFFNIAYTMVIENSLLITLFASILSLIAFFLIHKLYKESLIKKCNFKKISLLNILFCISLGIFLNYFISIIIYFIEKSYDVSNVMEEYEKLMDSVMGNTNLILSILVIGILGPIFEEILLRGIIQNEINKNLNIYLSITIQALIFSIIHGNIVQSSYALILGLVIGFTYYISKSIWTPIIIHATINLQSTVLSNKIVLELYSNIFDKIPYTELILFITSLIASTLLGINLFRNNEFSIKARKL
ncbi:MAG: CPBP family intramembrane glutamic endopeptidase [Clostridiales bacterium]